MTLLVLIENISFKNVVNFKCMNADRFSAQMILTDVHCYLAGYFLLKIQFPIKEYPSIGPFLSECIQCPLLNISVNTY